MPMVQTPDTPPLATRSGTDTPRLPGIDGRTRPAKRWRAIITDLTAALGRDPTPIDRALLVDAAALALESEVLAACAAAGERVDPDLRVRVSGALGRALERLGLTSGPSTPEKPDPAALFARVRDPDHWKAPR